jgi:hypothetical protein
MPPPSPPPHAACTIPAPPGPRSFSERASPRPRRHTAANPDHATAQSTTAPIPPHALAEASRSGPCRRPCHRSVPPPFHRMRSLKLRAPDHATAHATAQSTAPRRLHDSRATRTAKLQRARVAKAASPYRRQSGPCHRPVHHRPPFHPMRSLKLRAPDHAPPMPPLSPTAIPPHALAEASRSGPCHRPVHRPPPPARFPRQPDREASASARRQGRVAIPPPIRTMPPPSPPPPAIPPHALAEASRSGPCAAHATAQSHRHSTACAR